MAKHPGHALGRTLWRLRHSMGHKLTLEDLKDKTGIARSTLSKLENGKTPHPDHDTLEKLAKFYKLSGVGALYAMAEAAPLMISAHREVQERTDAPSDVYAIDHATLTELSDLTARLARLVGKIEGRIVRSEDAALSRAPADQRRPAGPRAR
jgi:transcriptional regulator with XRE-family HTH domain